MDKEVEEVQVFPPASERRVVLVDQKEEDEPGAEEAERETLSRDPSLSLYEEEEGAGDTRTEEKQAEKEKEPVPAPRPAREPLPLLPPSLPISVRESAEMHHSSFLTLLAAHSHMIGQNLLQQMEKQEPIEKEGKVSPQEKKIEDKVDILTKEVQYIIILLNRAIDLRIEKVEQDVQSLTTALNSQSEKIDSLLEKVSLVQNQGTLTYQTLSMAAVQNMQEAAAAVTKRPRNEPPPEANKRLKPVTHTLKCLATLIFSEMSFLDLCPMSWAAVCFNVALSATYIIFPTCHKLRLSC